MGLYYYVLGFHECDQSLSLFFVHTDSSDAYHEAQRFQEENQSLGDTCEQLVVVPAVNLWTLVNGSPQYFVTAQARNIERCYFCRSFLRLTAHRYSGEEMALLIWRAYEHGHCLWCHRPYRRDGMANIDEATHLRQCQVVSELREVDTP